MCLTYIFRAIGAQFSDPGLESLEGVSAGDVIHHQGHSAILIVDASDGLVPFLSRSVPELELHLASLCHLRLLEVDSAQCRLEALVELVVDVADGDAALAHADWANHDHFSRHLCLHDWLIILWACLNNKWKIRETQDQIPSSPTPPASSTPEDCPTVPTPMLNSIKFSRYSTSNRSISPRLGLEHNRGRMVWVVARRSG